ncbi:MAG: class I SAM-dependent DNA methyltransferase [Janthinobacterium lividum]
MVNQAQPNTLLPTYFDDVYAANADPWGFEEKPYEREKYADTLRSLPRSHYRNVFEIGCSLGVLTAKLAPRCDALLAVDGSEAPLVRARELCRDLPQVTIQQMQVPNRFPEGHFDLILVSEVGYYWAPDDLAKSQALILKHLEPGGQLMLVHWTPPVHDYPLTGDEVHESFLHLDGLRHLSGHREETYRLDLMERV